MNLSTYTFMSHPLTPPEKLWLSELARSPSLSPKFAKVKLYGQLPPDFYPEQIDPRLHFAGRPTPIGLWLVDQSNPLFRAMDQTIREVQRRIRADPTLTTVTADEIAHQIGLTEPAVAEALHAVPASTTQSVTATHVWRVSHERNCPRCVA